MTDEIDRNELIGDRVKFYRTSKKISRAKLVKCLPRKLTHQQFGRYEAGASRWPADLVCEVAEMLQIDIRLLLAMENGARERKDTREFIAEKYKSIMLSFDDKQRNFLYRIIDEAIKSDNSNLTKD